MQETTEVVESPQEQQDFSDVATDALRDALGQTEAPENNESPEIEETPFSEGETEPSGEVSSEEDDGSAEIVETDEPAEDIDRLAKRRVRPRNEQDQQVIDLYRSSGFQGSFQDASDIIYGKPKTPEPVAQASTPSEPEADPYESKISGIKESIVTLESQIAEATEDMDTAKAMQLQRDLFRKEMEISNLQTQRQIEDDNKARSAQESQRQRALESRNNAVSRYPELDNKESVYRKEFDHFVSNAEQDPDYAAIFSSPRWPEIMANEFAAMKGVVQSQPTAQPEQPAPQPAPQQPPVMGNQAKVLTTGQTAKPANQPISKEQILNNVGNLSNEQLFQMLGQPDGRKFLR